MARRKTGKEVTDKLIRRVSENVADYVEGVNNPSKNPIAEAIKKKAKCKQNFNAAMDDGSWEAGLQKWTQEEWSATTAKKGGERIVSGLEDARTKTEQTMDAVLNDTYNVADEVNKMADTTLQERIAKMTAYATKRAAAKRGRRRR